MTNTTPAEKLKVQVNGEEHELFMAYGLLNRLLKMFVNEEEALSAVFNSDLRDKVLTEVLTKRGKFGALETVVVDDLEMTQGEVTKLFSWVNEHFVDFFCRPAKRQKPSWRKFGERASALKLSQPGSTA